MTNSWRIYPINFILTSLSLALPLHLSFSGVCGDQEGFGWSVSVAGGQNLFTKKALSKPKTQDSTVSIHIDGIFFFHETYLQGF